MHNDMKLDILGFTETRLDHSLTHLHQISGYNMFNQCRNRYGGGVTLYVSSKYHSTGTDQFSLKNNSLECLGVEIKFLDKLSLCLCIYRPPSGNINVYLTNLMNILTLASDRKYQSIFALGD